MHSQINDTLLKQALKCENIFIKFGMRASNVVVSRRQIILSERLADGSKRDVVVECGEGRIIACDGLNSAFRTALTRLPESEGGITASVVPWKAEFRVLFAPMRASLPLLDEQVHYIFSGWHAATIGTSNKTQEGKEEGNFVDWAGDPQRWTCVLSAKDSDSATQRDLVHTRSALSIH